MNHWRQVVLEINYADLVGESENQTLKLVQFLGLESDKCCLDFHKSARVTVTANRDQVRQLVHGRSIARWQSYRSHLGPLIAEFDDGHITLDSVAPDQPAMTPHGNG